MSATVDRNVDSEEDFYDEKCFRTIIPQVLATTAKNCILIGYGMTLGFPTIVIPALSEPTSSLRLSKEELSWLGSLTLVAVPLGCLISGVATEPFGRKRSMQALTIPFLATWILFHFADSVSTLYTCLFIFGFTGGVMEAPVHIYVAEIAQPHARGFLSATSSLSVISGIFTQFLMGTFLDWRTISLVNCISPICAFIALCFIPESPHWLIGKNRFAEAEKSLRWLRGWRSAKNIQPEFESLLETLKPDLQKKPTSGQTNQKPVSNFDGDAEKPSCYTFEPSNYRKPTFYKPFLIICLAFLAGHFSGMTTLTTYAVQLFTSFGAPIDKYIATMILGLVQIFGTLTCVISVHFVGKRKIAFTSLIGAGIFFGFIGLFGQFYLGLKYLDQGVYFKARFGDVPTVTSWVPLIALLGGGYFVYMGIRLLPWILVGEVFNPDVRAFSSGICAAVGYIFGFISNKTFYKLIDAITLPGVYILYGCICFISACALYFVLPETEGWTLSEIVEHFEGYRNLVKAGRKTSKNKYKTGIVNVAMTGDEVSKL